MKIKVLFDNIVFIYTLIHNIISMYSSRHSFSHSAHCSSPTRLEEGAILLLRKANFLPEEASSMLLPDDVEKGDNAPSFA